MVLSKQEGSTPLPRDAKGKRMHEDTEFAGVQGTAGISRRDMLRKSAVVGGAGALMWAAPSITKFGGAAFGSNGTPVTDFSTWGALIECTPTGDNMAPHLIKVKAEEVDPPGAPEYDWVEPGNRIGNCDDADALEAFFDEWNSENVVKITPAKDDWLLFYPSGGDYFMEIVGAPTGYEDCILSMTSGLHGVLKQGNCCVEGIRVSDTLLKFPGIASPTTVDACNDAGGYWVQ